MSQSSLKQSLRILAEQAAQRVAKADDFALEYFSGATAFQDTRRDEIITELPAFESVPIALSSLPMVLERYGDEPEWRRLSLQFVYGFLGNLSEPTFDSGVFETTWEAFWEELSEPEWTWLGLANLRNFRSESNLLDLGDGITIRGRSFEELGRMGWSQWHLGQLWRELEEGVMLSSLVILTEHKLPKTPENFVSNETVTYTKALRTLLALRLFKDGDIGIGRMWFLRLGSFNLGLLGYYSMGFSGGFIPGSQYTLSEAELASLRELYDQLLRFEGARGSAPVNLDLALASFSNAYDRRASFRADVKLVDFITAIEALLGVESELRFRLAFRVAEILGNNDDERVDIFGQMRDFYDMRSRVVHGGSLSPNQQQRLLDDQTLRDLMRRLLVGFLRLTVSSGHPFTKSFFERNLDRALLHTQRRSELRVAMGLEKSDLGN